MENSISDNDVLQSVKSMIKPEYLGNSKVFLTSKKTLENSINVTCEKSAFRINASSKIHKDIFQKG